MELRQLKYFIAVAQLESFSRAAEHLHVAQSAISRQVQSLEEEMGVALLIRSNRRLQLTEAGILFLQRAESILEQLRTVRRDVHEFADVPKGTLRIGVLPFTGELLMPRVLARYAANFPDVRVHVRSGMSGFVSDWLNKDRIDLAVMHSPWSGPNLVVEPLVFGQMVVVLPPSSDAMRRLGIPEKDVYDLDDLATLPLILTSVGHAQRVLIDRESATRGFSPNVVLEADSIGIITALVHEGAGCTVIAYTATHSAVLRGEVRVAPLRAPGIRTDVSIVTRSDRPVTAAMRKMIVYLKDALQNYSESGELPKEYFQLISRPKVPSWQG